MRDFCWVLKVDEVENFKLPYIVIAHGVYAVSWITMVTYVMGPGAVRHFRLVGCNHWKCAQVLVCVQLIGFMGEPRQATGMQMLIVSRYTWHCKCCHGCQQMVMVKQVIMVVGQVVLLPAIYLAATGVDEA